MKAFEAILLGLGIVLMACGHISWWTSHANSEVTAARSIGYLIPGWTLFAVGYLGLRLGDSTNRKQG